MKNVSRFVLLLSLFLSLCTPAWASSIKNELLSLQKTGKLKILSCYSGGINFLNIKTGKEEIILKRQPGTEWFISGCQMFPGGNLIAYGLAGEYNKPDSIEIYDVIAKQNKTVLKFGSILNFSISPDGNKIAFVADTEKRSWTQTDPRPTEQQLGAYQSLYILNLKTSELAKVIENEVWALPGASWSPNGEKLLYETISNDILIYDLNTGSSKKILKGVAYPSWSSDSRRIYYKENISLYAPDQNYYSVKDDGTDKKLLLKNKSEIGIPIFYSIGPISTPIYSSPDGRFIIYGRIGGPKSSSYKIYIMELTSGKTVSSGWVFGLAGWEFLK